MQNPVFFDFYLLISVEIAGSRVQKFCFGHRLKTQNFRRISCRTDFAGSRAGMSCLRQFEARASRPGGTTILSQTTMEIDAVSHASVAADSNPSSAGLDPGIELTGLAGNILDWAKDNISHVGGPVQYLLTRYDTASEKQQFAIDLKKHFPALDTEAYQSTGPIPTSDQTSAGGMKVLCFHPSLFTWGRTHQQKVIRKCAHRFA